MSVTVSSIITMSLCQRIYQKNDKRKSNASISNFSYTMMSTNIWYSPRKWMLWESTSLRTLQQNTPCSKKGRSSSNETGLIFHNLVNEIGV